MTINDNDDNDENELFYIVSKLITTSCKKIMHGIASRVNFHKVMFKFV